MIFTPKVTNIVTSATILSKSGQEHGQAWAPMYLGFGKVHSRNSETATVTVAMSPFGILTPNLAVLSREWASSGSEAGYGERDLPPEGALVVVAFNDASKTDGVVIGSVLMPWTDPVRTKQTAVGLLATGKEDEVLVKTKEGHTFTRNRTTKAVTFDHQSGASISIDATGNININPSAGGAIKLAGGTTIGCNDLRVCLFTGYVPHFQGTTAKVLVP